MKTHPRAFHNVPSEKLVQAWKLKRQILAELHGYSLTWGLRVHCRLTRNTLPLPLLPLLGIKEQSEQDKCERPECVVRFH